MFKNGPILKKCQFCIRKAMNMKPDNKSFIIFIIKDMKD